MLKFISVCTQRYIIDDVFWCICMGQYLPVTWSQSAAVPAPQQKMLGARLWIFSQFLSPTMEPPVARVSAARATPSYKMNTIEVSLTIFLHLWLSRLLQAVLPYSYIENDTANSSTGLHVTHGLLAELGLSHEGSVADAVVIVEAALWQSIDVVQFHFLVDYFYKIKLIDLN